MNEVKKPQRQDSLVEQLADLCRIATREGMYDAADWIGQQLDALAELES
jgi:hypothetical protein